MDNENDNSYVYDAANITPENLASKSLFIGTPMYGGVCNVSYMRSCLELSRIAAIHKINLQFYFIANESLITRGRNYISHMFMRSGCTHMMFIDADIGFDPGYVFELLHACDHEQGRGIVGGLYPKKTIAWEKVHAAVRRDFVEKPHDLAIIAGDLVYNAEPSVTKISMNKTFPAQEIGTGFMMIDKRAMETYRDARPDRLMTPDHVRDEVFNGAEQITAFFNTYICPKTNRYLSEDYAFCQEMRELGVGIHVAPWMNLKHQGSYTFEGNLGAMLSLGVSATADINTLNKHNEES